MGFVQRRHGRQINLFFVLSLPSSSFLWPISVYANSCNITEPRFMSFDTVCTTVHPYHISFLQSIKCMILISKSAYMGRRHKMYYTRLYVGWDFRPVLPAHGLGRNFSSAGIGPPNPHNLKPIWAHMLKIFWKIFHYFCKIFTALQWTGPAPELWTWQQKQLFLNSQQIKALTVRVINVVKCTKIVKIFGLNSSPPAKSSFFDQVSRWTGPELVELTYKHVTVNLHLKSDIWVRQP